MKNDLSKRFLRGIIIIILLIGTGVVLLTNTFQKYRQFDISLQDEALENAMNSVDSTLKEIYRHYLNELHYIVGRQAYLEAEEKWVTSGQAINLLEKMNDNLLTNNPKIRTMLTIFHGKVVLSTDGKMNYWISPSQMTESQNSIIICSDEELNPYIAFVEYKKEKEIAYAVLMDPMTLYEEVEESSGLKTVGDMILTDQQRSMFMYRDEEKIVAELLNDEGATENPLFHILLYAHMKKTESIDFYEVKEGPYKEAYKARVAICPAELTENGIFSVGILHNEDRQLQMIKKTWAQVLLYGGMVLLGFIIMFYYLFRIYRQDARNRKELELLREKTKAVEALNKQTKELAHHQRLETIAHLTSGIAHEFNNLLTPIMGYSLMTLESLPAEDEENYDNLLEIYDAAQKAKTLISRLSDLSRKNTAISMHPVDPNDIIHKAITMVSTNKAKEIQLSLDLQCKDAQIYGNETQLTQTLMNLLINAFHAIGDQEGEVSITDYVKGKEIFIIVKDSGKGMTEEVKGKIFQPFYTTKEQGKGTGLGLAIVMQTMEEHKGTITVESQVNQGSSFILSFPVYDSETMKE